MQKSEIIFTVRKSPEGGYVARALDYPICMQADTMDDLKVNVADAVRCHFNDGEPLPEVRLVEQHFIFGSAKGTITVRDDFNDPLPKEIEDLFW
jgi:hypothetical protein